MKPNIWQVRSLYSLPLSSLFLLSTPYGIYYCALTLITNLGNWFEKFTSIHSFIYSLIHLTNFIKHMLYIIIELALILSWIKTQNTSFWHLTRVWDRIFIVDAWTNRHGSWEAVVIASSSEHTGMVLRRVCIWLRTHRDE